MPDAQPILTLGEVAEITGGELRGPAALELARVAPVTEAGPGDLTWVHSRRWASYLVESGAAAAIVSPDIDCGDIPAVVTEHTDRAIAAVLERLRPEVPQPPPGIHPTAVVADDVDLAEDVAVGALVIIQPGVRIGPRTVIHAGTYIGHNSSIGEDCVVWPQVVIRERCTIANRVTIHPNVTIGADGFGYNFVNDHYENVPQIGSVRIEDDVEIGAGCCIDRAKCGETVVGTGTKVDNLVQIAHNVKVGAHCCLVAQVGIGGSTVLEPYVLFGGKVGVRDNVTIGTQTQAAACSCIGEDLPPRSVVIGVPATTKQRFFRELAASKRMPDTVKMVKELVKRVEQLEAANDQATR